VLRVVVVIVTLLGVAGVARGRARHAHRKGTGGRLADVSGLGARTTVKGRVTIRRSGCPGLPRAAGCVYTKRPRVVYLRRGLRHPRSVLLHELGHVYDLTVLSNKDRGRFRRIMRKPRTNWWKGKRPLGEWFAEGYSWCARYTRIVSVRKDAIYRYRPSASQHRQICSLIKRAERDRTPPPPPPAPPVVTGDPAPPAPPPVDAGVVPGDPGPAPAEGPTPTPTATRTVVPPLPVPTIVPLPTVLPPTAPDRA
jgi:hypothetical protein